tara:strand:- start:15859 stop:16158 length:300 start_codon:yes stop_codon:yes gene_type:complete
MKRPSLAERQRRRLAGEDSRPRGRPAGSPHREYLVCDVSLSTCPACGCTDRTKYEQTQQIESSSLTTDSQLREVIVLRRCTCLKCGQHRVDRCREYRCE